MRPVARLGDTTFGTCLHPSHYGKRPISPPQQFGTIISGSLTVIVNNRPLARIGDYVLGDCLHLGIIGTASPLVTAEPAGLVARLGDIVIANPAEGAFYTGDIITGSTFDSGIVTAI